MEARGLSFALAGLGQKITTGMRITARVVNKPAIQTGKCFFIKFLYFSTTETSDACAARLAC
jgi:hypothetical protein